MREKQNIEVLEVSTVIVLVLLFALFPLSSGKWAMGEGAATIGLTILSLLRGWKVSFPLGVFCSVCIFCVVIRVPFSQIWLGLGLLVYIILCKSSDRLRRNLNWLKSGRSSRDVYLPALIFVLLSSAALALWFVTLKPNIKDLIDKFLPQWNYLFLTVGGVLFSMVNAAVEEGAYRGVIMYGLDQTIGPGKASMALQAAAFGTLHINGFPRGWVGVLLSTIFGVFMGAVRRRADGMLAPWIAHVLVDMVILCIVAVFVFTP